MIGPATTPQLWVEQWWQAFALEMEIARLDYAAGQSRFVAHGLRSASAYIDQYMYERCDTGCRSAKENIDDVRSLMALKYELRG